MQLYRRQFATSKGELILDGNDIIMASYPGAPTASATGYKKDCLFQDTTNGILYVNTGTTSSATWKAIPYDGSTIAALNVTALSLGGTAVTSTATELNYLSAASSTLTTGAGVGITSGTGTVYKTSVLKIGNMIKTTIYIDLTGLASIATDGDIIGVNGGGAAHIGRITAAQNGTIESMSVYCTETPAGGLADIDIFRATVGTGVQDDAISGITGQATTGVTNITTTATIKCATAVPAANDYLYLCAGASSGAGTYTAGKLVIELIGY